MHAELQTLLRTESTKTQSFQEVMATIRRHYECFPIAFTVGAGTDQPVNNPAGSNVASSQLLAFARRLGLSETETLPLYREHYRAVLEHPEGTDHANIRAFMAAGWAGVQFEGDPLRLRGPG
ncbi:MAG: HopJ type III effector protein [Pseudomonadota bacterium]